MDPQLPPRFRHEALSDVEEAIRLVVLKAGKQSDTLSCKIQHVTAWEDGGVQYEAISYVWDSQENHYDLACSGDVIGIGQNLKSALLRLRSEDHDRLLWIDQICIDQSDPVEHGAQVKLMAKIYGHASKVIVWLGEEDEETAPALELITAVARTFWLTLVEEGIDNTVLSTAMEQRLLNASDVWTEFGLPAQESPAWKAVDNLLNRPWFSRAWTYQEIIVAREPAELVCGSHTMGWWGTFFWFSTSMSKIALVLQRPEAKTRPPKFVQKIEYLRQINLARSEYGLLCNNKPPSKEAVLLMSLSFQLQDRRGCQATNPRDKIFSLLNIVYDNPSFSGGNQFKRLFPQPDYNGSLAKVYIKAARYCLYADNHLGLLYDVERPKHDPSFPSWVPDWRASWQGTIRRSHNRLGTRFSASIDLPPVFWQESSKSINDENPSILASADEKADDSVLRVMGMRMSIVEKIEPDLTTEYVNSAGETARKMGPHFWRILKMCGDLAADEANPVSSHYVFTPELEKAFTSILSADDAHVFTSLLKRLQDHWSLKNVFLRQHDSYYAADTDRQIDELAAPLAQHLKDVRMFETNHEDLCIGPRTVEIGDHLAVLLGGSRPFLLRDASDATTTAVAAQPSTYLLRGECYSPRFIKGEGVRLKSEIMAAELAKKPDITYEHWIEKMKLDPEILHGIERMRIL